MFEFIKGISVVFVDILLFLVGTISGITILYIWIGILGVVTGWWNILPIV